MLETCLESDFSPGTNLENDLAGADWRFLMPSLEMRRIVSLGMPSPSTLTVLSKGSTDLSVVVRDGSELERAQFLSKSFPEWNLTVIGRSENQSLPFQARTIDLVFIERLESIEGLARDDFLIADLNRVLNSNGVIYFEHSRLAGHRLKRSLLRHLRQEGLGAVQSYWLTPFHGPMRTAGPVGDERIGHFFFSKVLTGRSLLNRVLSRIGRCLSRMGVLQHILPRRAGLIRRSLMPDERKRPPEYLVTLAADHGIDLEDHRFGVSARGKCNSNKIIFFFFTRRGCADVVAKVTRSPCFNYRLEHEHRVLSLLVHKGFVKEGTLPTPLFLGYHAGRAIAVQKAIEGDPFRARTRATSSCPIARAGISWITQLGASSARESQREAMGTALQRLYHGFNGIYRLDMRQRAFLEGQLERLTRREVRLPTVVQHGDPGTHNILVSPSGDVIFLDWESSELKGMPLWDLFYFLRAYGSWARRIKGHGDALDNFVRHFLLGSPLTLLFSEAIRDYCQRIGVRQSLVEPLFYSCWMHRALKEVAMLAPSSVQDGRYVSLLRLILEPRNRARLAALVFPHPSRAAVWCEASPWQPADDSVAGA
ncbi:MAG: phosphotransferase family protein [Acidobacteriota bacterium]